MDELDLSTVSPMLHHQAVRAFDDGDADGFIACVDGGNTLALVFDNRTALLWRGIYEEALLGALSSANTSNWRTDVIDHLFDIADLDKLRDAGDPLPGQEPFTLYRGVNGHRGRRRVRGISWTDSLDIACYFASVRYDYLPIGSVYAARVDDIEVFAYLNEPKGRGEREFIVRPKVCRKMTAIHESEIFERGTRYQREFQSHDTAAAGATI